MKKALIVLAVLLVVIIAAGYTFRGELILAVMKSQIGPEVDFNLDDAPAVPDYASASSWAALPTIDDPSDQRPDGVEGTPGDVAVFFVHPTSFFGKRWNQPLDDESANWVVDERILRHQASVFNSCCDVYAPRYRQATLFSFMDDTDNGEQALDLAYGDVVRAFEEFVVRLDVDQPFILAGHSQGTKHATRLLQEEIASTQLLSRMVAAYLVGFSVSHDQLGDVPACQSASQTGCAIGWNAMDGEGPGAFGDTDNLLCTNPLTWAVDTAHAGHDLNTGAIGYPTYGPAEEGEDITQMLVEVGIADAQCSNGQLAVMDLRSAAFPSRMVANSMHVYDYSLYHMNIRDNVAERIAAYNLSSR
jgi:pimeloyl-ACP methyl ester carboxylesterase